MDCVIAIVDGFAFSAQSAASLQCGMDWDVEKLVSSSPEFKSDGAGRRKTDVMRFRLKHVAQYLKSEFCR